MKRRRKLRLISIMLSLVLLLSPLSMVQVSAAALYEDENIYCRIDAYFDQSIYGNPVAYYIK